MLCIVVAIVLLLGKSSFCFRFMYSIGYFTLCQAKLRYATDLVCGGPAPLGSRNEMTLRGRGTVLASSYRVSEYKVESKIRQQTKIKRAITESFSDSGFCSRPLTELDANREAVIQGRTDEELQAVFSQAR